MSSGDFKPGPDARRSHAGQFKPGPDPRRAPGGKPSLQRDLERAGAILKAKGEHEELQNLTPEEARARWWATVLPVAFAGPKGPKDSNWTYAASEVGDRLLGKPKESLEVTGGITPEQQALLDALRLTPHERRLAEQSLAAQDSTAREDDEAMAAMTDSANVASEDVAELDE